MMLGKLRIILFIVYAMCSFDKTNWESTLDLNIVVHFVLNDVTFDFNVA
jgi:hypothetical protein